MDIRTPCTTCGTRDKTNVNVERESVVGKNGVGEMLFTAQGQADVGKLESLFPRDDGDEHMLSYVWESPYAVRLIRTRVNAPVKTKPGKPALPTQLQLENLSDADLETKAGELSIEIPARASKAKIAAMVLEALTKKAV